MSDKKAVEMSSQELAEAAINNMIVSEELPQKLAIKLLEIKPGYSRTEMAVEKFMLNGHKSCHGGIIFALADTAFAYACNSYNGVTVSASCSIDFLAPAFEGDTLYAEAKEKHRGRRTGVYYITVTNQDGVIVALFRGNSHQLKGTLVD